MEKYQSLVREIHQKKSMLCIGLDTDPAKIPEHLHQTSSFPELAFNKAIIEATKDTCVAYKLNIAFYEQMGIKGWQLIEETLQLLPANMLVIADAKRGDIGNTSYKYAETFFETYQFDAITVSPYMGEDSVKPFLSYTDKWTILLGLTSNQGSEDFQTLPCRNKPLYEHVLAKAAQWAEPQHLMFVVGATHPHLLTAIREIVPRHFLLVPGVGKQGGKVEDILKGAATEDGGVLINASRSIIYASDGEDYADAAREQALSLREQMKDFIPS